MDRMVRKGKSRSRNEFLSMALRRELAAQERSQIDEAFGLMAPDPSHRAESEELAGGFEGASWEALRAAAERWKEPVVLTGQSPQYPLSLLLFVESLDDELFQQGLVALVLALRHDFQAPEHVLVEAHGYLVRRGRGGGSTPSGIGSAFSKNSSLKECADQNSCSSRSVSNSGISPGLFISFIFSYASSRGPRTTRQSR